MNIKKKILQVLISFGLFLLVCLAGSPVMAQDAEFRLSVNRNFGYSSGSQIRGTFTLAVVGPEEGIESVTYLIDDQKMMTVYDPPYKFKFKTSDYSLGWHEIKAVIEIQDKKILSTPARKFEFASSEQESATMQRIVFPLFGGIIALITIGMGAQVLIMKNKPKESLPLGAARKYGISGGAICPNCQRPFALHWWGLNLGPRRKYDRCNYCGHWGMMKRADPSELALAEAAEIQLGQSRVSAHRESSEDRLNSMIEDSRYIDNV
jgi:Zn ribbon nucleic-acid-binding protein